MINPLDINLDSLPWIPLDSTAGFPAKPGIYFAIDSLGNVQYIGRSGDVRGRWKSHHRYEDLESLGSIKIAYLFIDSPELLPEIETALIEWFEPPLNIQTQAKRRQSLKEFNRRIDRLLSKIERIEVKAQQLSEARTLKTERPKRLKRRSKISQAHRKGGNPNPTITPEFEAKKFKPVSEMPDEPLAKNPVAVKLGQSIHDVVMALPQKERIEFLRTAITDRVRSDLLK